MDELGNNCKICESAPAKYICPRCGLPYCSVQCYRNEAKHLDCSETFYRKCVMDNVKEQMHSNPEQADKMKEILGRFSQEFGHNSNMGDFEDELGNQEELDSDDDEPLDVRMQGINLDDTDEVWKHLTEEEKADFKKLAAGANAIDIIPEWIPWWTKEPKKKLVEELSPESSISKLPTNDPDMPKIIPDIPLVSSLTKIRPNNHVKIGLSNVIAAYVWTSRIYAGEVSTNDRPNDVAGALITLSGFLGDDTIFDKFEHAVANVPMKACQNPIVFDGGPTLHKKLQDDVLQILSSHNSKSPNTNKLYVLSALSDCFNVLTIVHKNRRDRVRTNIAKYNSTAKPPSNDSDNIIENNETDPSTKESKATKHETFENVFPTPPPAFEIDSKVISKAKRKLHYLLAFANEYDVL